MAERDKTEMESEVSKHEFDLQGSRIICRSARAFANPPSCTVLQDSVSFLVRRWQPHSVTCMMRDRIQALVDVSASHQACCICRLQQCCCSVLLTTCSLHKNRRMF